MDPMDFGRPTHCLGRQVLMRPLGGIKREIMVRTSVQERHRGIILPINIFRLHRTPAPFNEDIIQGTPLAVHAHATSCGFDHHRESLGGELDALVRVENLRRALG